MNKFFQRFKCFYGDLTRKEEEGYIYNKGDILFYYDSDFNKIRRLKIRHKMSEISFVNIL